MAGRLGGDPETLSAGPPDERDHVIGRAGQADRRRPLVHREVPRRPRRVKLRPVGRQQHARVQRARR